MKQEQSPKITATNFSIRKTGIRIGRNFEFVIYLHDEKCQNVRILQFSGERWYFTSSIRYYENRNRFVDFHTHGFSHERGNVSYRERKVKDMSSLCLSRIPTVSFHASTSRCKKLQVYEYQSWWFLKEKRFRTQPIRQIIAKIVTHNKIVREQQFRCQNAAIGSIDMRFVVRNKKWHGMALAGWNGQKDREWNWWGVRWRGKRGG